MVAHYHRPPAYRRHKTLAGRFWAKVDPSDPSGCWIWTDHKSTTGYGRFSVQDGDKRLRLYAHRVAWELTFGPILNDMCFAPLCDTPPGAPPPLLFLGPEGRGGRKSGC